MTAPFRGKSEGREGLGDSSSLDRPDYSCNTLEAALESLRLAFEEKYPPEPPIEYWWQK